ncbi:transposase is4 [Holotrichia oblita]|uniref:Transposase is4 n=2 Tax=Holotrichia oblita TaxID=644536 RepID=A0ACB9SKS0_HOLOL|nr:transposase is4 [Holotrichia oblita]KAI4455771.1 transposase is4 [Holotrichia oblita]
MSRNRFEAIHRYIHLNDNSSVDPNDRVYKIRPLIQHLNNIFQKYGEPLAKWFSLDAAIEPYYGHHSMKQFIRGKPIRYGYKFWCLSTSTGYLLKCFPYTGAGESKESKRLGSSVTEKLCLGYLPNNSVIFIANYFNSLPLLEILKKNNTTYIGTIRADRIAPLKDLKKETRGTYYVLEDKKSGITLTRWHDNCQVTMATNMNDPSITSTKGTSRRWSRNEKGTITVEQPTMVGTGMG